MTNGEVRSAHDGRVVEILVSFGRSVGKGDELAILDAEGARIPVRAPMPGMVALIEVKPGAPVKRGDLLVMLSPW